MVTRTTEHEPIDRLANWQIAVLALYSLGGATSRKHGEEVALKCYEIAPRRFGWGKHPQLEPARVALRDAKKEKYGSLVAGSDATGWLLTKGGLAWCEENAESLSAESLRQGLSALAEPEVRVLLQLMDHRLFEQWRRGQTGHETLRGRRCPALPCGCAAYSGVSTRR